MTEIVKIKAQVIEDLVMGITFEFRVTPSGEGKMVIHREGEPPRDHQFDENGEYVGSGTFFGIAPHLAIVDEGATAKEGE
jgi:hypothetical protein